MKSGSKKYKTKKDEKLLFDIIISLCADYSRRKECILKNSVSKRVKMEYVYLNSKLFDAAAEVAGEMFAERYIYDIGNGIGYARSNLYIFSESTYKEYKIIIKENMLKKLKFID